MTKLTAAEIAKLVSGELKGNPDISVESIASLSDAGPEDLSFLNHQKYHSQLSASNAQVILIPESLSIDLPEGKTYIFCSHCSKALTAVNIALKPTPPAPFNGISDTAFIADDVILGKAVSIAQNVVIESGCKIGDDSVIGANSYIGANTEIGINTHINPNVTIHYGSVIGSNVIIHSGTVIGADGFGFEPSPQGHEKIPQLGIVEIEDNVELGANCCIDRARFGVTRIKAGAKLDNLVQIAHNCTIGDLSFMAAQSGLAGSTKIGKLVQIGGQSGVVGHTEIGDGAIVMSKTAVISEMAAGECKAGFPGIESKQFFKQQAALKHLPALLKRVRELENQLEELTKKVND